MELAAAFLLDAPGPEVADAAESWVQVAKTGAFTDPRYGKFRITLQDFSRWLKNFAAFSIGDGREGLPVDRDHAPEKTGDTEAVGWVKQLEQRGQEMWGRVVWNPKGKELIAEKRYAYISPSYSPDLKDESGAAHGTALVGIALTNRPFLQMATVNLSKFTFATAGGDNQPIQPDDVTDLDWSDGDDNGSAGSVLSPHILDVSDSERQKHAVIVKKINGKTQHMFPIAPGDRLHASLAKAFIPAAIKAGHITEAEAATVRARADSVLGNGKQHAAYSHRQMELTAILTALNVTLSDLGVDDKADEPTVLAALAKHQEASRVVPPTPVPPTPPTPAGGVVLSQDQVTQLLSDASAGRAAAEELRVSKFDGAFLTAQQEGRVVLAQKETFRTIFDQNSENALKLLSELQPVVQMTPAGSGALPADLGQAGAQLATDLQDSVTPYPIDMGSLRIHAAAVEMSEKQNIDYEIALSRVEAAGVTL